jgi:hypothetical protein
LSGQSEAAALFSTVRYTLCDTYIDFLQSDNSGKSILSNIEEWRKAILQGKGNIGLSYSGKSSSGDRKMLEIQFDQTKPSQISLSR